MSGNFLDLDAENPGSPSRALLDQQGRIAFAGNVNARTGKTIRQGQLGAAWEGGVGGLEAELATWGIDRQVRNPIPGTIIDMQRGPVPGVVVTAIRIRGGLARTAVSSSSGDYTLPALVPDGKNAP